MSLLQAATQFDVISHLMARLLFTCAASTDYIRNRVIVRALRRQHEVTVVGSAAGGYPQRLLSTAPRLPLAGRFDAYFLGFLAQPLFPFLAMRRREPVILDAFVSVFDTLCLDRQSFKPGSPVGRAARWLDAQSLRWATHVLTDTDGSADFMSQEFRVPRAKFSSVPVGADESIFSPRESVSDGGIRVLYYSSFLPLHGVSFVLEAAKLLKGRSDITFTIIGKGPESARVSALARQYELDNCRFIDWVSLEDLASRIADCSIFLAGHFNPDNEKARRVVPGKAFQALAMERPIIAGDYQANQEWFRHGENAWMVPPGDAEALAAGIEALSTDVVLRRRLAGAGHELFDDQFSESAIGARLDECLDSLGVKI